MRVAKTLAEGRHIRANDEKLFLLGLKNCSIGQIWGTKLVYPLSVYFNQILPMVRVCNVNPIYVEVIFAWQVSFLVTATDRQTLSNVFLLLMLEKTRILKTQWCTFNVSRTSMRRKHKAILLQGSSFANTTACTFPFQILMYSYLRCNHLTLPAMSLVHMFSCVTLNFKNWLLHEWKHCNLSVYTFLTPANVLT